MGGGRYPGNRNKGANAVGPAGHHQPARRHPKKETLKFDNDYDFEQANEQFQEFCSKFEKANLECRDEGRNGDSIEEQQQQHHEDEEEVVVPDHDDSKLENFYDKTKSFFDNISCEALERSRGGLSKPDWKAEKKLNRETFGASGNFNGGRGRGYYYNRGGGYYGG